MGRRVISEQDLISHYRRCVRPLYSYVSRRTGGDRPLTEDLVQETWLRALGDWRRRGLPREPMAWLIEAFHFDGKALAEIADELGISERAAEGRMRRVREALKAQFGAS